LFGEPGFAHAFENRRKLGQVRRVVAHRRPGRASAGEGDGNNLYLRVDDSPDGGKRRRWIVRVTRDGKKRDFGAGSAERTSLKLARKRRDQILAQLADGLDPVAEKREARQAAATARNSAHTFGEAAEAVFKNREPGWKRGSSTPAAWVKSINVDCKALCAII
jgi:Arm DNA-binding domain